MSSSEEYLDSLLKAAIDNDTKSENEIHTENNEQAENEIDLEGLLSGMDGQEAAGEGNQPEELDLDSLLGEMDGQEPAGEENQSEELDLDSLLSGMDEPEPAMEEKPAESLLEEESQPEELDLDSLLGEMDGQEAAGEENQSEELDLDSLLSGMDEPEPAMEEKPAESQNEEDSQSEEATSKDTEDYSQDIAELLGTMGGEDEELAEISELLSQSGDGKNVDDDMLALLENLSEESGSEYAEQLGAEEPDDIDIFAMDQNAELSDLLSGGEEWNMEQAVDESEIEALLKEKPEPVKEKKKWFGKGKKKKDKKKAKEEAAEAIEENTLEENISKEDSFAEEFLSEDIFGAEGLSGIEGLEALAGLENGEHPEEKKEKKPKKQGAFGRFIDFLMEEEKEEEEPPKKEKAKKGKKDKKAAKAENAGGENEALLEELEAEDKNAKKKKVKTKKKKEKEKKKQEKPQEITESDGKKLPKKIVIGIFVVCFSIMILLIIVSMMLPNVMSLKEARKAYYNQDYKTAYENLAGKDLNSSDSLMLEKATTLMTLQRQYESFANYHKMGKELEALNALVKGCNVYVNLKDTATEQNVLTELDEIYTYILDSLEYLYGVTEDQAIALYCIEDDAAYTQELQKIVDANQPVTGGSIPAYQVGEETSEE